MKRTEGQKGITLIALVVTIVVLLILAGITITYVFSEGGLFDTARDADKNQTAGYIRDYASNAQAQALMDSYNPAKTATFDATAIFKANFPTTNGWTALADADVASLTYDATKHQYGGSFTVTVNGYKYTGTYTDGVLTSVTWEAVSGS